MFIKKLRNGYYDASGQQHSGKGKYLALFAWSDYRAMDEVKAQCEHCEYRRTYLEQVRTIAPTFCHSSSEVHNALYEAYRACSMHRQTSVPGPRYPNGEGILWAQVRTVSMSQCGQFMMGHLRMGGKTITVSGSAGSDGLPLDYQDCPPTWREHLVEVPEAIAAVYWKSEGWNDVGASAKDILRAWALQAFRSQL